MTKSQTVWSNGSKNPSSWVGVGKSGTTWSNEATQLTPYLYDSPTITYNNAFTYDYLQMVANQTNNKNATSWVQS